MGACTSKHRRRARELYSSSARHTGVTELKKVSEQKNATDSRVQDFSILPPLQCQRCPADRNVGPSLRRTTVLPTLRDTPVVGVRICGVPTPRVPESQPYLVLGIHKNLLGPFAVQRGLTCKLNVTEVVSQRVHEAQVFSRPRFVASNQTATLYTPQSVNEQSGVASEQATSPTNAGGDTTQRSSMPIRDVAFNWSHGFIDYRASRTTLPGTLEKPQVRPSILRILSSSERELIGTAWRLCVSSVATDLPQDNFESSIGLAVTMRCHNRTTGEECNCHMAFRVGLHQDKAVKVLASKSAICLADIGVSVVCKKGFKFHIPNSDGFFVLHENRFTVCCILDGHGPFGHDICNVVQQDLIQLTVNNPALAQHPKRTLQKAFQKVHKDLATHDKSLPLDSKLSGTTATIVVHLREQQRLVVAHVGNSRAVLCKLETGSSGIRAVDLTVDHTPSNAAELRRIVKSGGQVRVQDGDGFHRIFLKDASVPGLALARSIGDTLAGGAGVIAVPDIREYKLDPKRDVFLLLCTDGVWNIMSSEEAVKLAHSARQKGLEAVPEELARESWRRWINQEQVFADDITALFMGFS